MEECLYIYLRILMVSLIPLVFFIRTCYFVNSSALLNPFPPHFHNIRQKKDLPDQKAFDFFDA